MYCKRCGTKNKDDARFCANCGQKLIAEQPRQNVTENISSEADQQEPARKLTSKSWIIALACVIVVIAGIFVYQNIKSKDKKENTKTTTTEQSTKAKTTEKTTEANTGEDVADSKEDNTADGQGLAYTDNDKMDLTACTDKDNYQYVTSKDKSFGFLYPKYLFNKSYISDTGDQYILEHTTGDGEDDCDFSATFTKTEVVYENDQIQNVEYAIDKAKSKMKKVTFEYPKTRKPRIYRGQATKNLKGYLDDDTTKCQYWMVTSDKKYTYTMVLEYYDSDYKDEHKDIDYVADCMYRGCSFTNASKKVRSFKAFKKDQEDK